MQIVLIILLGYLIGSIPFGVVIGRLYKIDITKYGSGNIGMTNVLRALGAGPGLAVLVLDLLKGTLATYLGILFLKEPLLVVLIGLAAILGHMFSIFLKLKGGKGAAVGLGVLLAVAPDIFFFAALLVIAIILITRYVSLASIIGPVFVAGLMLYARKPLPYTLSAVLVAVLMILKHLPNIKRLMTGTERKIGESENV
jgi:glycerol-3-phosphate acyltransferase PlsY